MISKFKKFFGLLDSSGNEINPSTNDAQTDGSQKTQIVGSTGNVASVNSDGQLHTVMEGKIDTNNTTTTPLSGLGVWTGTGTNVLAYAGIGLLVETDQDGELEVDYSPNNSDWFAGEVYTIKANSTKFFTPPRQSAYYRLQYTNGAVAQTTLNIHPILSKNAFKWSSHNIEDPITSQDDATLTKAVITGLKPTGDYDNVSLTNGGNMKCSLEELESGISVNSNSQLKVTQYDSSGNEFSGSSSSPINNKIIGSEWISGNDGVDLLTNTLQVIDYSHHEIHSGSMFRVQHNQDNIPATGSGGCLVIAFFVPDQTKQPHMVWETSHEGNMTAELLEGVTFNASAGTDRAPKNSNRNSSNASVLQGKATGSLVSDYVTVGENSVDSIYSGGTSISLIRDYSARNEPGGQARRNEVVLKTNTNYAFCLMNNETSTQGGQIRLEWYEHTPKN